MRLNFRYFCKIVFYALLIMATVFVSSCSETKKSAKIKRIERQPNFDADPARNDRDRVVRRAIKQQDKRQRKRFKEDEKQLKHGINKRHLAIQDKETRKQMKALRKQSKKVNKRR